MNKKAEEIINDLKTMADSIKEQDKCIVLRPVFNGYDIWKIPVEVIWTAIKLHEGKEGEL